MINKPSYLSIGFCGNVFIPHTPSTRNPLPYCMSFLIDKYHSLKQGLDAKGVTLVAVSKTKSAAEIKEAYDAGQRDFGENYVQELVEKYEALPKDIRWHFIGHLQTNKVKYIAPFVHLIHGVDSEKLLLEINKQGQKLNRIIPCLLQVHIAAEETKFGLDADELSAIITRLCSENRPAYAEVSGLMGMASFTEDNDLIKKEFSHLKQLFDNCKIKLATTNYPFSVLSMGMSADYGFAIEAGSTMVRIGSLLFGSRIRT